MKSRPGACGLLLWIAIAAGCLGDAADAPSESVLNEGRRVFAERCAPCHGETGHGDGPLADALPIRPRNYQRDAFKWGTTPREIAATVRGGRSGVMPAFEGALTEQEIRAVTLVVWSWLPPERRGAAPPKS